MPHDRFEPIANTALVQLVERLANELKRSRVEFLPLVRRIRIPVKGDRRATDRRLNDRDGKGSLLPDSSSKHHFRPERTQRLERHPTLGGFIAIAQDVRVKHVTLRLARAFEVRVVVNAIRMRVRPNHVGLTGEEEHTRDLLGDGGAIRHDGQRHRYQCGLDCISKRRIHGVPYSMVGHSFVIMVATAERHNRCQFRPMMGVSSEKAMRRSECFMVEALRRRCGRWLCWPPAAS